MKRFSPHSDIRLQRGAKARADILRGATRVFAVHGPEGARTEAIAEAAHVNKALLFYHFKTKDDLFAAVVEELVGEVHRRLMDLLSGPGPASEVLLRYLDAFFDAVTRRPDYTFVFQRAMLTNSRLAERMIRRFFTPRTEKLAALIRRGVKEGEFRRVEGRETAMLLTSMIAFNSLAASVAKKACSPHLFTESRLKERKRAVMEFVRYGLFRDPEAGRRDA